ncbi:uncharacterized protein [Nothobranchius furzeri]|uniref:uncharacterized protein n=1 Tax=Nothobranchius furzeri TaxID=105023 RepID=UPI003904A1F1
MKRWQRDCVRITCKRGPTDMYGCTRFLPELPPEETDDTVEEKRQRLQSTHSKYGINRQDRPEVTDLMNTTFSLQRKHINRIPAPSLTDLQTSWPYLFTQRGIFSHFELLTDVAILRALELSIEEFVNAIVEYFRTKVKTANVQTILAQEETDDLTFLVVQLLMAHFKESPDGLILTTDEFATAADVETSLSLPASPRLILSGNEQKLSGWMVSAEGRVIFEGVLPTFSTGLAAVFATFYIFNLQYQDEAAKTLEFVQRDIDPSVTDDEGTNRLSLKADRTDVEHSYGETEDSLSTLRKPEYESSDGFGLEIATSLLRDVEQSVFYEEDSGSQTSLSVAHEDAEPLTEKSFFFFSLFLFYFIYRVLSGCEANRIDV